VNTRVRGAHPGVNVKMTVFPFAGVVSFDAKLLAALSSAGGPDPMGDRNYKRFLNKNYLALLDPRTFG
jgi:ABC-type glycerol-3-phosphate transport system substrate-binding protein